MQLLCMVFPAGVSVLLVISLFLAVIPSSISQFHRHRRPSVVSVCQRPRNVTMLLLFPCDVCGSVISLRTATGRKRRSFGDYYANIHLDQKRLADAVNLTRHRAHHLQNQYVSSHSNHSSFVQRQLPILVSLYSYLRLVRMSIFTMSRCHIFTTATGCCTVPEIYLFYACPLTYMVMCLISTHDNLTTYCQEIYVGKDIFI